MLHAVYDCLLANPSDRPALAFDLAALHNEKSVDVLAAFEELKVDTTDGPDFFSTRGVLADTLAQIDAAVEPVMRCVVTLYREAGQDLAAGSVLDGYVAFCSRVAAHSKDALETIRSNPDQFADLLVPTLVAGSRLEIDGYVDEALSLCKAANIALRRAAVFALGRLAWTEGASIPKRVLETLEYSVENESDDRILGNAIKSAFSLLQRDDDQSDRATAVIVQALGKGDDYVVDSASTIFAFDTRDISPSLLRVLTSRLIRVNPNNKGTVDRIDQGVAALLKRGDAELAIRFLEELLLAHPGGLKLANFDATIGVIRTNDSLLSRVLTRWFLRGDKVLCEGVQSCLPGELTAEATPGIDPSELEAAGPQVYLFIARKVLGYLLLQPVAAASILISIMRHAPDDQSVQAVGELLFDPLMLNFTGAAREYVQQQATQESGKIKDAIDGAIRALDEYLLDLNSVGDLPALYPSESQREAQHRFFSRQMEDSWKTAMSQSALLNLFPTSVLLYGRSSINYVKGSDGQSRRMETPLARHGTTIEFPRMQTIAPYDLEFMQWIFRAEKLSS